MSARVMGRRLGRRLCAAGVSLAAASAAFASQIDATWLGGSGAWNVPGNWDVGTVPDNAADTYNAVVDDPADSGWTVNIPASVTIDNLSIGLTEIVQVDNGRFLQITGDGTIDNAGILQLNSTGSATYLRPTGGALTLSGGGTVLMSDQTNNWIYRSGAGSLINLDNTIEGAGRLGWSGAPMAIENDGLVVANVSNALNVDGTGTFTNTGTLRADGGPLVLSGGTFENAGGVIEALDGSIVSVGATTVFGGTLQTAGSGEIQSDSVNARLDGAANTVDLSGTFRVPNNRRLRGAGTWNNTGTIVLDSTGSDTYLFPENGTLTLTGGGTIQMSDQTHNWIYRSNTADLVNLDNTIEGAGQLGWAGAPMAIENDGLVLANVSSTLNVDGSGTFTNNGTLRADGGPLVLSGGTFENAGGVIEAMDGSTVYIGNTEIAGGTLQTAGTGEIQSANVNARADGTVNTINISGTCRITNNQRLRGAGTWNNTGTIVLDSTGNNTYLNPENGTLTLTGGGTIRMSDEAHNLIYRSNTADLVNLNNTIEGAGQLGSSAAPMAIENDALVLANVSNALNVDGTGTFTNHGTLRADGGPMVLSGGTFQNAGGVIEALDGSTVSVGNTTIVGGTLQTAGSGEIQSTNVNTRLDGTASTVHNAGTYRVPNNQRVRGAGIWNNTGTIVLDSSGNDTYLFPENGTLTLTGGGTIQMSDQTHNWIYRSGAADLVNADNTIRGSGHLGWSGAPMDIVNQGTVDASGTVDLSVHGGGVNGFVNEGTLMVTGTGGATIGGVFTTSGSLIVDPNRTLSLDTDLIQTGGATDVFGQVTGSHDILLQGGVLDGAGSVVDVVNSGGIVAPGASAGTLTVAGNYTQQAGGTLSVELGGFTPGVDQDLLVVTGTANLGGAIQIATLPGFDTTIGDSFVVLSAGSVTGGISQIDAAALPDDQSVRVCVSPTTVEIHIVPRSPGDADRDGDVDITDLGYVLAEFGATGPDLPGDVNGDGAVNVTDLGFVLANFGASVPCN